MDEASAPGDNGCGDFRMLGGNWTYTLDNSHAAVQALDDGASLTDTHTFTASDGSTRMVSIVIAGAPEAVPLPISVPPTPEPIPEPDERIDPPPETAAPVDEEPDAVEPPPENRTDPSAGEPEADGLLGKGLNSAFPESLEPGEILLSVLADARPHDASGVQKVTAPTAKPTAETAQTFLQELKSFWQKEDTGTSIQMSEVHLSRDFWEGLDKMGSDLDESVEEQHKKAQLSAEAAAGVGISLTAGFVSWALRAGSMAASFLAAMPTWRHFDPMPVLAADEKKKQGAAAGDAEDDSAAGDEEERLDDLFDR